MMLGFLTVLSLFSGDLAAQEQGDVAKRFASLKWQQGPTQGALGEVATIRVPTGYRFVGRADAGKFMELLENPGLQQNLWVASGSGS
jgi:uncharacterized membrane-anchored protein